MKIIPLIRITETHANPELCGTCKGACCKLRPGILFPLDIDEQGRADVIQEEVYRRLESGKWVIDCHDDYPSKLSFRSVRYHYVRPAMTDELGQWYVPNSYIGTCNFHSDETGCALSDAQRPSNCKALIPHLEGCKVPQEWGNVNEMGAQQWLPYQTELDELIELDPHF